MSNPDSTGTSHVHILVENINLQMKTIVDFKYYVSNNQSLKKNPIHTYYLLAEVEEVLRYFTSVKVLMCKY